jgi:hypothetical protein
VAQTIFILMASIADGCFTTQLAFFVAALTSRPLLTSRIFMHMCIATGMLVCTGLFALLYLG